MMFLAFLSNKASFETVIKSFYHFIIKMKKYFIEFLILTVAAFIGALLAFSIIKWEATTEANHLPSQDHKESMQVIPKIKQP